MEEDTRARKGAAFSRALHALKRIIASSLTTFWSVGTGVAASWLVSSTCGHRSKMNGGLQARFSLGTQQET
jgi:hypothetical protein